MEYRELLSPLMQESLDKAGYERPTPIQEESLELLLQGKDLVGIAQTGTGKTAAFAIPIIERTDPERMDTQALILCPTRELALQITNVFMMLSANRKIRTVCIYGGQNPNTQIRKLEKGAQIVVGTPGRVRDMMGRKVLKLHTVRMAVLDEADEMLDFGFLPDIKAILGKLPRKRQTMLFSATMDERVEQVVKNFLYKPEQIQIGVRNEPTKTVSQMSIRTDESGKIAAVGCLFREVKPKQTLIFCNTRHKVKAVTKKLNAAKVPSDCLHGDLTQHQRDTIMQAFRNGEIAVLVATDVAARGIDVDGVDLVINYDVPDKAEYYVHRIGRTGRAGNRGLACTLITDEDGEKLMEIRRLYKVL